VRRPLSAPGSDKRWLGLLSYFPKPTPVNQFERKKAKQLQSALTILLSTILSRTPSIILSGAPPAIGNYYQPVSIFNLGITVQ
jgi:hypothetical protein